MRPGYIKRGVACIPRFRTVSACDWAGGREAAGRNGPAPKGLTLIELLVVIAIVALLVALLLPALSLVRQHVAETVCSSNLRQMAVILKNNLSPIVTSFRDERRGTRREVEIFATAIGHEDLPVIPQYTYAMNGNLYRTFRTASLATGVPPFELDARTLREWRVHRETHVTRSPSEVFAFGEENSWAVHVTGRWPAPYNLSGRWLATIDHGHDTTNPIIANHEFTGTVTLGGLDIWPSYAFTMNSGRHYAEKVPDTAAGDAFATYHRPRRGDLNTGHSYVSMLDGHVRKVPVSDQLRKSRRVEGLPDSRLGPGGNLHLAWPLDVPPLGGWENQ